MKIFKYALTSVIVAVLTTFVVMGSQQWTDNCYEATRVAGTDLQNMENNFAALKTNFSGSSSPSDADGSQWWADTSNHILKLRNEADTGWLEVWDLINDRPMGLDAPGTIGGTTPGDATFADTEVDSLALQSNTESLTGDKTISTGDPQIQFLDPDGADRNVTLPAEASNDGINIFIFNTADGVESLVVKDDGGSTIKTVGASGPAVFGCDGSSWKVLSSGGGAYSGGPPAISSTGTAEIFYSESWVTVYTEQIYIPENCPNYLYIKFRSHMPTGTLYSRFQIDGNTSSETSYSGTNSYVWGSEVSLDISGITPGSWYSINIQGKGDTQGTYGGIAARYGD